MVQMFWPKKSSKWVLCFMFIKFCFTFGLLMITVIIIDHPIKEVGILISTVILSGRKKGFSVIHLS